MANDSATQEQTEVVTSGSDPEAFEAQLEQWKLDLIQEGQQASQEEQTDQPESEESKDTQTPTDQQPLDGSEAEADEDADRPLSRREAFRLAEQRQKQLQEAESKAKEAEQALENLRKEDAELNAEVQRALGTDEQYQELTRRTRAGDRDAGRSLDQIDANRAFFGKLVQKANRDVRGYFVNGLFEEGQKIGMPEQTLKEGTPAQIMTAAFKLGQQAKEQELNPTLEALQAESRGQRVANASRKNGSTLSGGKGTAGISAIDDWFNENGGLKEEYIEAARRGELSLD